MEEKAYPFVLAKTSFRYEFTSKNEEKEIKKVVIFTKTDVDIVFNLALLDELEDGELSDISESNNKDLVTVMATIVQILQNFLNQNPSYFVVFRGSEEKRQRLYRIIISRELDHIQQTFDVFGGYDEGSIFKFEKNTSYDYYIIRRKLW